MLATSIDYVSEALLTNGSTQKFIAKRYSTTEANFHHWLNQRGLAKVAE